MKKFLCVLGIIALLPVSAFAEDIFPQDILEEPEEVSYASITDAAYLADADESDMKNTTDVTSLVVCFYDFSENTISKLSDVLNYECLMDKIYRIDFKSSAAAESAYVILKSHPNVKCVDYDMELKFDLSDPYVEAEENVAFPSDGETANYPYNDYKLYGDGSWYLDDISAPKAWEKMKEYDVSQNSAVVAVIDSGIDTANPDLKNRILTDKNGNMVGYNFVNSTSASFEDDYSLNDAYHGTRVASAIAAEAGNGVGICGVAGEFDVKILPIKVFSSNGTGATASILIEAINKAVEHKVDVINLSLASIIPLEAKIDSKIETMQEAINRAVDAGCVVVGAAGNYYSNQPYYPASYDNVISVASYGKNRERSSFSQYNDYIDVAAPGSGMALLKHSIGGNITDATVNVKSAGTSFSAPVVSAAAALLRIANPEITPTEISNIIKNSATDLGKSGYDIFYGFGALNLENTINNAYNGFVEIKSLDYTKSLTVAAGDVAQIETVILPKNAQNKTIKFESADTSIATVSNNGVVFGVAPGEVDIYITTDFNPEFSKDENGKNYVCKVFVKPSIQADGKINEVIGTSSVPRVVSGDEFAIYHNSKILQFKKNGDKIDVATTKDGLGKEYKYCEYLPESSKYKYVLVREVDHKTIFAENANLVGTMSLQDNDSSNPTYVSATHNGKDKFVLLSSSGRILYYDIPSSSNITCKVFNFKTSDDKVIYMNDIVYIPHEKCKYYAMTGQDLSGGQYLYLTEFKTEVNDQSAESLACTKVGVTLSSGEVYKKLLVEGQYLYVLTNKAVYTIKTGRDSKNALATSGALKKYADVDSRVISDIAMISVGNSRVLTGYGVDSNLYLIESGGESTPIKSYSGTISSLVEFNNSLLSFAGGSVKSEKVTYTAPENKSLTSELCTYRINILDKNNHLVSDFPTDGRFTVEYYAESIDRIIFNNEKYSETSPAQNKLPVSVVFAIYNKENDMLEDIRVNNFMLDYAYISTDPALSFGSLLRCEESFDVGSGEYYAKVMTFKGNNFYWPKKGESTTTLDVFTKPLEG